VLRLVGASLRHHAKHGSANTSILSTPRADQKSRLRPTSLVPSHSNHVFVLPDDASPVAASLTSIILAALSFIIFSAIFPLVSVTRVTVTTTNKLFYNHYRSGSQLFASLFFATNFVFSVTIGCEQKSASLQAIHILIAEVVSATSVRDWLKVLE
jgi:hypothetical protein